MTTKCFGRASSKAGTQHFYLVSGQRVTAMLRRLQGLSFLTHQQDLGGPAQSMGRKKREDLQEVQQRRVFLFSFIVFLFLVP